MNSVGLKNPESATVSKYTVAVFWLPLLQVTVSQRAIDELVGCPLQGEVIPSLVEGQVATQHLHVLLLP